MSDASGGDVWECVICISSYPFGVTAISCGHAFHGRCVAPHVERHGSCPLCRLKVARVARVYDYEIERDIRARVDIARKSRRKDREVLLNRSLCEFMKYNPAFFANVAYDAWIRVAPTTYFDGSLELVLEPENETCYAWARSRDGETHRTISFEVHYLFVRDVARDLMLGMVRSM